MKWHEVLILILNLHAFRRSRTNKWWRDTWRTAQNQKTTLGNVCSGECLFVNVKSTVEHCDVRKFSGVYKLRRNSRKPKNLSFCFNFLVDTARASWQFENPAIES
jgi:hypothetical protein